MPSEGNSPQCSQELVDCWLAEPHFEELKQQFQSAALSVALLQWLPNQIMHIHPQPFTQINTLKGSLAIYLNDFKP